MTTIRRFVVSVGIVGVLDKIRFWLRADRYTRNAFEKLVIYGVSLEINRLYVIFPNLEFRERNQ